MWDLPGPGLEPVCPALAGGFLTTAPPGKSQPIGFLVACCLVSMLVLLWTCVYKFWFEQLFPVLLGLHLWVKLLDHVEIPRGTLWETSNQFSAAKPGSVCCVWYTRSTRTFLWTVQTLEATLTHTEPVVQEIGWHAPGRRAWDVSAVIPSTSQQTFCWNPIGTGSSQAWVIAVPSYWLESTSQLQMAGGKAGSTISLGPAVSPSWGQERALGLPPTWTPRWEGTGYSGLAPAGQARTSGLIIPIFLHEVLPLFIINMFTHTPKSRESYITPAMDPFLRL